VNQQYFLKSDFDCGPFGKCETCRKFGENIPEYHISFVINEFNFEIKIPAVNSWQRRIACRKKRSQRDCITLPDVRDFGSSAQYVGKHSLNMGFNRVGCGWL
jgi:hypothetical protein